MVLYSLYVDIEVAIVEGGLVVVGTFLYDFGDIGVFILLMVGPSTVVRLPISAVRYPVCEY